MQAETIFSAVMNMTPPTTSFKLYNRLLLRAATDVCEASLGNAALEVKKENEGYIDYAAAFDGTRQKRGHTSLKDIVTVTSFDSGKVLDSECLSKHCNICTNISDL